MSARARSRPWFGTRRHEYDRHVEQEPDFIIKRLAGWVDDQAAAEPVGRYVLLVPPSLYPYAVEMIEECIRDAAARRGHLS